LAPGLIDILLWRRLYSWARELSRVLPLQLQRRLTHLPPGARRDLLRVLASPSDVRADLIRQMYERLGTRDLAELLMDLEAEPDLRLSVMEALKDSLPRVP
jgi:hypothetical protein